MIARHSECTRTKKCGLKRDLTNGLCPHPLATVKADSVSDASRCSGSANGFLVVVVCEPASKTRGTGSKRWRHQNRGLSDGCLCESLSETTHARQVYEGHISVRQIHSSGIVAEGSDEPCAASTRCRCMQSVAPTIAFANWESALSSE